MGTKVKKEPRVHIERGAPDRILPKHFIRIISRRFFPVLSLTYVSSVIGMAFKKGNMERYLFEEHTVFTMALFAAGWVSIPAILWIILKGSHLFNHVANIWYWVAAFFMSLILFVSFLMFPEVDMYGARIYCVATIPMMFVMYFFLAKQPFTAGVAHFMSAVGIAALIYGAILRFL